MMNQSHREKMIMDLLSYPEYKPMKMKEILAVLGLTKKELPELTALLERMVIAGDIVQTAKNKYMLPPDDYFKIGKFISHPSGFGFVEVDGMQEDLFVPAAFVGSAFYGDIVSVRLLSGEKKGNRRMEAEVMKVIQRGITTLTGTYHSVKEHGYVVPDRSKIGKEIRILKNAKGDAKPGDKVVVRMLSYGSPIEQPKGEIIEILGGSDSVEVDITAIIRGYELHEEFPVEAIQEAQSFLDCISEEELALRADYRDKMMITIDGADAKDLDDAISIQEDVDGFILGVHIADVSHFVTEFSALDREAVQRGTSHYLVDRVLPMLPKELSNGICSLHPGVDRLALSCMMKINNQGKVVSHEIKESVIRSSYRMTYDSVAKLLEPERTTAEELEQLQKEYEAILPDLKMMAECAEILWKAREARGAIDFDFMEAKFLLNSDHSVREIVPYERNVATRLIEDFMLIANETVAEHFYWQGAAFVYRNHGEPKEDKISELAAFLRAMNHPFRRGQKIHPKDLQNLLSGTEQTAEANIIRRMVLRSMQQARYAEYREGHFGLATKYYTHFTSPIRRYPDLQIHRIIKEILKGKWNADRQEHYASILPEVASKSSMLERRAEEAEREVHKLLKAYYMEAFVGQTFEGIVSGANQWAIFVELPNTVEGVISISTLDDDYYEFDEKQMAVIGARYQKGYYLGDKISIQVEGVDRSKKAVLFRLPRESEEPGMKMSLGDRIRHTDFRSKKKSNKTIKKHQTEKHRKRKHQKKK